VDDVKQTMMGLIVTSLRIANGLLQSGHVSFRCFAVALRPDGGRVCVVSDEADFAPVLALLPGTVWVVGGAPPDEPAPTAVCLGVGADDDDEDATVARLRQLAERGEVVATAVVEAEPDWDHPSGPRPTVWVELEHQSDWTLLYTQAYSLEGGTFQVGEVGTYEHEAEVFVQ
jgi:hypothetical protein